MLTSDQRIWASPPCCTNYYLGFGSAFGSTYWAWICVTSLKATHGENRCSVICQKCRRIWDSHANNLSEAGVNSLIRMVPAISHFLRVCWEDCMTSELGVIWQTQLSENRMNSAWNCCVKYTMIYVDKMKPCLGNKGHNVRHHYYCIFGWGKIKGKKIYFLDTTIQHFFKIETMN